MHRAVANIIAAVERSGRGFADVPPGSISDELESELAALGYAASVSERLWIGGIRIYSPDSIKSGHFRLYVPPSIFSCATSVSAHVPDAGDFDVDAILEQRGEIPSN